MDDPFKLNHGFPILAWERAKEEAREVIHDRARSQRTIFYSELAAQISSITFDPHDVRFGYLLGQVASEDDDTGNGLTTVLVVHKTGDLQPGSGFYDLARFKGRQVDDEIAFWSNELKQVYRSFSSRR
jgi:hypothetical protein